MPFQITICAATSSVTAINISLRPDVTSPCIVSLDLIATVTSGRTEGHTFLWELSVGAPVEFTTPVNQLIATCTLTSSSDRIFTFWVDKGTTKQKSYVFNYYGTATDIMTAYGGNTVIYTQQQLPNSYPSYSSIYGTQAYVNPTIDGYAQTNPSNIVLVWNLPSNRTGLISIHVEQDINGEWIEVLSLVPTDTQMLIGALNNTYYRIKTVYLFDNQYYINYSSVYYLMINFGQNIYAGDLVAVGRANTSKSPIMINYTLLNSDSVTNQFMDLYDVNGMNTTKATTTVNYTLLNSDSVTNQLMDLYNVNGMNTTKVIGVTCFGGTIIGG